MDYEKDVYGYVSDYIIDAMIEEFKNDFDFMTYFDEKFNSGMDSDEVLYNDISIIEDIKDKYYTAIENLANKYDVEDIANMLIYQYNIDPRDFANKLNYYGLSAFFDDFNGYFDGYDYDNAQDDANSMLQYALDEDRSGVAVDMIISDLGFELEKLL